MSGRANSQEVTLLGVRHHSPGAARAVLGALEALQPDLVLLEGPPEAETVLPLAAHPDMRPPVALLLFAPDTPGRSQFYPMAVFSPEWNAIRFAQERDIPLRFFDLPAAHSLALEDEVEPGDPIEPFSDDEWWELPRPDPLAFFRRVTEEMAEYRASVRHPAEARDARREAFMRQTLRKAIKEGYARIAVVCGAFHVPALADLKGATDDAARLKGLPKAKVSVTWTPWSYDRLGEHSGYGAGVRSPAFCEHLWTQSGNGLSVDWMLRAARLLRSEGHDASPASVIESVRLADALTALRARPRATLQELEEACLTVLCEGRPIAMSLIERQLMIGERIGEVPAEAPLAPVAADLQAEARRLRLKFEDRERDLDLDLRNDTDLDRSVLFHRLLALRAPWAAPLEGPSGQGTFRERWRLRWTPELGVALVAASRYGTTIEAAAVALTIERTQSNASLVEVTEAVESTLLGRLDGALEPVMAALDRNAAMASDVGELLDALGPLAQTLRYGTVRRTPMEAVARVFDSIFARACVGLPAACASLDDEAAAAMAGRLAKGQAAIAVLHDPERHPLWHSALSSVADLQGGHGLVAGLACRLLMEGGAMDSEAVGTRLARAVSKGTPVLHGAQWIEGFLGDSGALLLHDDRLYTLVDRWIGEMSDEQFLESVPLLRRTFARFPRPERIRLMERAKGDGGASATVAEWDEARALAVLPLVDLMLGEPR